MPPQEATCLHVTCGCVPSGERAYCSDYCETQHVDDVVEVESCRCGHRGCGGSRAGD
jgi:hypothetical protein